MCVERVQYHHYRLQCMVVLLKRLVSLRSRLFGFAPSPLRWLETKSASHPAAGHWCAVERLGQWSPTNELVLFQSVVVADW